MVVHSPISNETGVRTAMAPEAPNPASDVSAPGRPIMVRVNAEKGNTLSVAKFTLTDSSGANVAARILVPSSAQATSTASTADPNNLLPNGTAVLLPLAPLNANTTYTVTFNGARDGAALPATSLDLHDRRKLITHRFPMQCEAPHSGRFFCVGTDHTVGHRAGNPSRFEESSL